MPSPFTALPDALGLAVGLAELSSPLAVPPVSPDTPDEPVMPLLDDDPPAPLLDDELVSDGLGVATSAAPSFGRIASPLVAVPASPALTVPAVGDAELSRPMAPPPAVPPDAPLEDMSEPVEELAPDAPLLDPAPEELLELEESFMASAVVLSPSAPVAGRICSLDGRPAASGEPAPCPALCAWTVPKAISSALERIAVLNLFMKDSFVVK